MTAIKHSQLPARAKRATSTIAETLEEKGLWRRAAAAWVNVAARAGCQKMQEAASIRSTWCARMAKMNTRAKATTDF
ncbi:PerC family transcriptional regulator [Citrobacter freundii]|nr:PerC family transcriptional regulator [Citrobacter freundii]